MKLDRLVTLLLAAIMFSTSAICVQSQESKPTIRHHRVEEPADDVSRRKSLRPKTAMQHNDFAAAEPLLQKAVAAKPNDYRAWFDLGYVYNATDRRAEAIDAYRKAVAAKPDVFESNLNLGLLLAKQGENAEAAKYLKAATQLKPTDHPERGLTRAWQALGRVEESADPQQALAAYAEAAKLSPKDPATAPRRRRYCCASKMTSMRRPASIRLQWNSTQLPTTLSPGWSTFTSRRKNTPTPKLSCASCWRLILRTVRRVCNWRGF